MILDCALGAWELQYIEALQDIWACWHALTYPVHMTVTHEVPEYVAMTRQCELSFRGQHLHRGYHLTPGMYLDHFSAVAWEHAAIT